MVCKHACQPICRSRVQMTTTLSAASKCQTLLCELTRVGFLLRVANTTHYIKQHPPETRCSNSARHHLAQKRTFSGIIGHYVTEEPSSNCKTSHNNGCGVCSLFCAYLNLTLRERGTESTNACTTRQWNHSSSSIISR